MKFKRHQSTFDEKLSATIGLVIGLLFLGAGYGVNRLTAYRQATFTETQGTVVDSLYRRDLTQNRDTYAPVIEFRANGEPTRFIGSYETFRSSNGHRVAVRYNPERPAATAEIINPLEDWVPWGVGGLGGAAAIASLAALIPVRWSAD
jgi:hypothetical protein